MGSIGRFARSMRWRARKEWARPSPMRGVMLFSLAGIAGEDDLDAPDLNSPEPTERAAGKTISSLAPALERRSKALRST